MSLDSLQERDTARVAGDGIDIQGLNSLALRALVSLFEDKEQLFCRRLLQTEQGIRRDGVSPRSTIVALLGLQNLAKTGAKHPFDIAAIGKAIFEDQGWIGGIGDLGLLIWFTALSAPTRLDSLFHCFDLDRALETYPDACQRHTQELALFLGGLAHAKIARPQARQDLTDLAVETYHKLQENQGEDGIFGSCGPGNSLASIFGSGFGTFSDQIASVYALSKFAQAFQVDEPLEAAMDCANAICGLQGEMGQWWSLYEKRRGRVACRYPILSVHQDGMSPAGLFALEEATGQNFRQPIYKGLAWIFGANELGDDLRDPGETFIWDSIARKVQRAQYLEAAFSLMGISRKTRHEDLNICYEARPDHFGWLLYAFGSFGVREEKATAQVAGAR